MRNRSSISLWIILVLNGVLALHSSDSVRAQAVSAREPVNHDALFQAIRTGSTDELVKILAKGADANDSLDGYSALMAATLNGSVAQMKILIDQGAEVNYLNNQGISSLWLAVPDWDKTKLLLDFGADVLHTIDGYGVLVKLAAMPGTIKLFQLLMDRGADLKKSASDNYLLYNAASCGDTSIIGLLIRSGFNVNDTVVTGDYPIINAMTYRRIDALKMLVENGADVNAHPMNSINLPALIGFTPLMGAALNNDKPSLLYLLQHGADPNLKNKKGYTALMLLEQSEVDDPEMTLALISHGAIVTQKAPDGTDALFYAERRGNTPSAGLLKKYAK